MRVGLEHENFREDDEIPNFPTGVGAFLFTAKDRAEVVSGGNRVQFEPNGFIEFRDYNYRCVGGFECAVTNGVVTMGTIRRSPTERQTFVNSAPRARGRIPPMRLSERGAISTAILGGILPR